MSLNQLLPSPILGNFSILWKRILSKDGSSKLFFSLRNIELTQNKNAPDGSFRRCCPGFSHGCVTGVVMNVIADVVMGAVTCIVMGVVAGVVMGVGCCHGYL